MLPFSGYDVLKLFFQLSRQRFILRQKNDTHAIVTFSRELPALFFGHFGNKPSRHLHEDASTIAGIRLRPTGSPVIQINQHLEAIFHDLMRFFALHVRDEADATGVVLKLRIIEALLRRKAGGTPLRWCVLARVLVHW
jgi:hypothetical protein